MWKKVWGGGWRGLYEEGGKEKKNVGGWVRSVNKKRGGGIEEGMREGKKKCGNNNKV